MRRFFFLFIFLLTVGCAHSGPSFLSHAIEEDIQESQKLIDTGHYKEALDELSAFLDMSPKNPKARFLRGRAYQELEQFSESIKDYEWIIQNSSKDSNPVFIAKSHYNLGMIFGFKTNDAQKALDHFDAYLSLVALAALADSASFAEKHSHEVAKIMCSLDQASLEDQKELPTQLIVATRIENISDKKKFLEELSKTHPTSPVPDYVLAQTFEKEGQFNEAISIYQNLLKKHPTCGPCHEALGNLLLKKKKTAALGQTHKRKAQFFMSKGDSNL